jgi:hypothetical protein
MLSEEVLEAALEKPIAGAHEIIAQGPPRARKSRYSSFFAINQLVYNKELFSRRNVSNVLTEDQCKLLSTKRFTYSPERKKNNGYIRVL